MYRLIVKFNINYKKQKQNEKIISYRSFITRFIF